MISLFLGFLIGIFTGLTPGIHINLIASLIPLSFGFNFLSVALFFIGLSISHNFFENIPNLLFGVGEEENSLNGFILHKMYLNGVGLLGIRIASLGNLFAGLFFLTLFPLLQFSLILSFTLFNGFGWIFLIALEIYLLTKKKFLSGFFVFLLSGLLGVFSFTLNLDQVLLSLFSGLFGLGSLIEDNKTDWVSQKPVYGTPLTRLGVIKQSISGIIGGLFLSFVPSIGPTQATMISNTSDDEHEQVLSLGFINGLDVYISLLTLFLFAKARSGVLVKLSEFGTLTTQDLYFLIIAGFSISCLSFFILNQYSSKLIKLVSKLDYRIIKKVVILFLVLINFYFNSWSGLLIFSLGGLISIYAIKTQTLKSHLMGVLMLPTILAGLRIF